MNTISTTDETKKKIHEAFLKLYYENSIEKITIKMISEKANISRSTFYTHYEDIYDLRTQLEESFFKELCDYLVPGIPRIFRGENLMEIMPESDFFFKYQMELKVFIATYGKSDLPERLKDVIREGFQNIISTNKINVSPIGIYTLEYMMNAQLGTFAYWIKSDFDIDFDELKLAMAKFMNEGPLTFLRSIMN